MGLPPVFIGAVKAMVTWPLPAVAVPMVGGLGTVSTAKVAVTVQAAVMVPVVYGLVVPGVPEQPLMLVSV